MPLAVDAWAKVNLTLRVTGRRPDGYHLLDSLIVFAGAGDRLEFAPAPELALRVYGPFAENLPREGNLVLRAARMLAQAAGVTQGARITLHKNLPVAAGIGGGSADAAAALLGLCRLWALEISDADLATLALRLGADVPVCLKRRPCRVSGIGELIDPLPPLPGAWLVLANPGVHLATADVFQALEGGFSSGEPAFASPTDVASLAAALRDSGNDLEAPARRLCPEIGGLLNALWTTEGCLLARMSGSGATCFGLYAHQSAAEEAAPRLRQVAAQGWVTAVPLLPAG